MRLSKLSLGLFLLVAACVEIDNPIPSSPSEPEPLTPSHPLSLTGQWHHTATVRNPDLGMLCTSSGTLNLDQPDSTFTGTYQVTSVCTGSSGTTTAETAATVSGLIEGTSVFFTNDAGCFYSGTVMGDPADQVSGTGLCNFDFGGSIYTFTGTWQAGRATAI